MRIGQSLRVRSFELYWNRASMFGGSVAWVKVLGSTRRSEGEQRD